MPDLIHKTPHGFNYTLCLSAAEATYRESEKRALIISGITVGFVMSSMTLIRAGLLGKLKITNAINSFLNTISLGLLTVSCNNLPSYLKQKANQTQMNDMNLCNLTQTHNGFMRAMIKNLTHKAAAHE
jgi:hypothetical protein